MDSTTSIIEQLPSRKPFNNQPANIPDSVRIYPMPESVITYQRKQVQDGMLQVVLSNQRTVVSQ